MGDITCKQVGNTGAFDCFNAKGELVLTMTPVNEDGKTALKEASEDLNKILTGTASLVLPKPLR